MRICFATLAVCCVFLSTGVRGQTALPVAQNPNPVVTVNYASLSAIRSRSQGGRFDLMPANAGETMQAAFQFPVGYQNLPVVVQSLDGALVSVGSRQVASDGTLQLAIAAGAQPGLYRVQVISGGITTLLQFWVPSPDPKINPPVLQPAN